MHARLSRTRLCGFTLLELIVTIVVLGVLAALAVPAFSAVIDRSKDRTLEAELEALGRGISALAAFDGELTEATAAEFVAAEGSAGTQIATSSRWTLLTGAPTTGTTAGEIVGKLYVNDDGGFLGAATVVPHDPARVAFLLVGAAGGHAETTVLADVADVTGTDALCFYGIGVKDDGTTACTDDSTGGGTSTVGGAAGGGGTALSGGTALDGAGTTSSSDPTAAVSADGPVAFYKFEETTGTTLTDDTGVHHGTYSGTPGLAVAGAYSGSAAVRMSGDDDAAVADHAALNFGTGDYTVEAYIRKGTLPATSEKVVAKYNSGANAGWLLIVRSDGTATCDGRQGGVYHAVASTEVVVDGTWHHLACVRRGPVWEMWVDGNLSGSLDTGTVGSVSVATALTVGSWSGSDKFVGDLDNVALFDTALSATQLAAHTSVQPPSGLTATSGDGQVDLAWNAVADAASYRVYVDGVTTLTVTAPTTTATVTGLTNGTSYGFQVSSVDADGAESALSATVSATPNPPPSALAADNFDRTGTLPGSTPSTGTPKWVKINAYSADISTNGTSAVMTAGSWGYAKLDTDNHDGGVAATVHAAGAYTGITFRIQADNHLWRYVVKNGTLVLESCDSAGCTSAGSVTVALPVRIRVALDGGTISAYYDEGAGGSEKLLKTVTGSTFSTGRSHGILVDSSGRLDDFEITGR